MVRRCEVYKSKVETGHQGDSGRCNIHIIRCPIDSMPISSSIEELYSIGYVWCRECTATARLNLGA
jgi:hypothetical protein